MAPVRLKYQTLEFGKIDIHLCSLRNKQEFSDPNGEAEKLGISSAAWPIFGIVWPSSIVLARFIMDFETSNKRILEVGCGLGLSSILLNKQGHDITATDHHPSANGFLTRNTLLNGDPAIPFERVGWADLDDQLGLFDLIIGSDLLYEDEHIELLSHFLVSHSRAHCEIIIVDPGRGRKNKLIQQMEKNDFSSVVVKIDKSSSQYTDFNGVVLIFSR